MGSPRSAYKQSLIDQLLTLARKISRAKIYGPHRSPFFRSSPQLRAFLLPCLRTSSTDSPKGLLRILRVFLAAP